MLRSFYISHALVDCVLINCVLVRQFGFIGFKSKHAPAHGILSFPTSPFPPIQSRKPPLNPLILFLNAPWFLSEGFLGYLVYWWKWDWELRIGSHRQKRSERTVGRRSEEPGKEILMCFSTSRWSEREAWFGSNLEADFTLSQGPDLSLSWSKEPAFDSKTVITWLHQMISQTVKHLSLPTKSSLLRKIKFLL